MTTTHKIGRFFQHIGYQIHRGTLPLRRSGFSTFDEERILNHYITEFFGAGHRGTAVDIGAGDGRTGSNTLALFKNGWKGIGIEGDDRKAAKLATLYRQFPNVEARRFRVTPDNVLALLEGHGVETNFSLLSIDIDSYDYLVLDAILSRYRPGIVISEINEKIPPPIKFSVNYDPDFQLREHFYGYSIAYLEELCGKHDYAVIDLEYNNVFLAPREIAGGRALTVEEAYRRGYADRPDRHKKFHRNENMEFLQSASPEEGIRFIRQFFAQFNGKYELSVASGGGEGASMNRES
ncbi:MAG TPA: hypothetical protein VFV61_02505 [Pyrinomonadaceae bacterium]|nr:hypothetical protein [Pyrinomonadaceae bacterium]